MNYAEQQTYLAHGRIAAIAWITASILLAAFTTRSAHASLRSNIAFALVIAATAVSLAYTPDYLHLSVNLEKRLRWAIKIRWRVAIAVLVAGLALASNWAGIATVVTAAAWVTATNLLAGKVLESWLSPAYFWITDFLLLALLLLFGLCSPLVGLGLLVASAHLSIVICERLPFAWSAMVSASAAVLLPVSGPGVHPDREFWPAAIVLFVAA